MKLNLTRRQTLIAGGLLAASTALPALAADKPKLRFSAVFSDQDIRAQMMKQFSDAIKDDFDYQGYYGGTLFKQGTELVALQRAARLNHRVHLGIKDAVSSATFRFGAVHGEVSALQQALRAHLAWVRNRDTDAGADCHVVTVDFMRRGRNFDNPLRKMNRGCRLRVRDLQNGEFVAAEPGNPVG